MAIPPEESPRDGSTPKTASKLSLTCIARFPKTRVLAWNGEVLYASRGYRLLRSRPAETSIQWEEVARFSPVWWRKLTSANRLGYRLMRDGFHALVVLPSGELIAALPGAIATLRPGEREFQVTHVLQRGTRPLNIAVAPDGSVFWGEYFDNPERDAVHIYGSDDRGASWKVVHSFEKQAIRHIHNIVCDYWENCFWVLTGDVGPECRVLSASLDWSRVESVISGNQQARAVAAVPREDGVYFATDTPLEQNYIYRLDRRGGLHRLAEIHASVLCGCAVGDAVFFTTMIEQSAVNLDRSVGVYGRDGNAEWASLQSWTKDRWSEKLFQYGNGFVATGNNSTNLLAITTVAVKGADLEASIWSVDMAWRDAER
jgi:hypothetical protein